MRIVVVGGTGHIGQKVVALLQRTGEAVVVASPSNGVDAVTGEGLAHALEYADAVIDVSNPRELDGAHAHDFFVASAENLLTAEEQAGVKHHVLLSIVGSDTVSDGYFAAKAAQEAIVMGGSVPSSILRATQFFEFAYTIAAWNTAEDTIRLPSTLLEPVAADDVAAALVRLVADASPAGIREIGGPERMTLDDFVRRVLVKDHDHRYVVRDDTTEPVGFNIESRLLLPAKTSIVGVNSLNSWLDAQHLDPSGTLIPRRARH